MTMAKLKLRELEAAKLGQESPGHTEAAAALDAARLAADEAEREARKAKHAVIEAKGQFK